MRTNKGFILVLPISRFISCIGLLSFVFYYLLKNPSAMRKLREEVDTLIGERPMTVDDVHKLPYLIGMLQLYRLDIFKHLGQHLLF